MRKKKRTESRIVEETPIVEIQEEIVREEVVKDLTQPPSHPECLSIARSKENFTLVNLYHNNRANGMSPYDALQKSLKQCGY